MAVYRGEGKYPGREERAKARRKPKIQRIDTRKLALTMAAVVLLTLLGVRAIVMSADLAATNRALRLQEQLNRQLETRVTTATFELERATSWDTLTLKAGQVCDMHAGNSVSLIYLPER